MLIGSKVGRNPIVNDNSVPNTEKSSRKMEQLIIVKELLYKHPFNRPMLLAITIYSFSFNCNEIWT